MSTTSIVVAEGRAALGDRITRRLPARRLVDGVRYVVGRQKLALLDVDERPVSAPRPRGRSGARGTPESGARPPLRGDEPPAPGSWTSVITGRPNAPSPAREDRQARVEPEPRNERLDVRLALSNEALNTHGRPWRATTAMRRAMPSAWASTRSRRARRGGRAEHAAPDGRLPKAGRVSRRLIIGGGSSSPVATRPRLRTGTRTPCRLAACRLLRRTRRTADADEWAST